MKIDGSKNSLGQLGNGTTNTATVPVKIYNNVKKIETGHNYVYFLTYDNVAYGIGDLNFYTAGGFWGDASLFDKIYTPYKLLEDVKDISQRLFYKNDGTIWGYPPTVTSYYNTYKKITQVASFPFEIKGFWYDYHHYSFFLKDDGSLWVYGEPDTSSLARNFPGVDVEGNIQTPLKIMDNVKSFDPRNLIVLTKTNELWAWGSGFSGIIPYIKDQHNSNDSYETPVKILDSVEEFYGLSSSVNFYKKTDSSLYEIIVNQERIGEYIPPALTHSS